MSSTLDLYLFLRNRYMNKSELIDELAKELEIPSREAASVLSTILEAMTDTLVQGENIEIRGFGSFSVRQYEAYEGRNPKTGEVTHVKPKKLPFFKIGKDLREQVNAPKS